MQNSDVRVKMQVRLRCDFICYKYFTEQNAILENESHHFLKKPGRANI